MLQRAKSFMERHERRLSVGAFALGFLWDYLTLTRIDRLYDNVVLISYLAISLLAIIALSAYGTGRLRGAVGQRTVRTLRFLLPFAFGGLFSGFLIFYSQSGVALASAPFLLVLGAFFVGNELLKKHYERFIFQMTVFFVALFAYSALIIPVLLDRIGAGVFVISGITSLVVFFAVLHMVKRVAREEVERGRRTLVPIVAIVFVTFNLLYFNNMIPPVPLSLREIGVYHEVSRLRTGEYLVSYEKPRWYELGRETSKVFHSSSGEPIYALSSIYAPTGLSTSVVHRWSRYDEREDKFISVTAVPFIISGGRREGFRGYTLKENITEGTWRVDVETERGQTIGRLVFTVERAFLSPSLETKVR